MKKRSRFVVIKFRTIKLIAFILLCTCLLCVRFDDKAVGSVFLNLPRKIPIYCVENDTKQIAITFDAAWGSDKTGDIIEILNENDVKATFFLVGMWVDKNEDLTKKISENGFEIGTHSNTHKDFTKLSGAQIELELSESKRKIESITGKDVKLFRAPYGAYNNTLIEKCEALNLKTIQWDVDSLDWKGISSGEIANNILKKVKSGSIILCHNNADHIVDDLKSVLPLLKARGFEFVTVSELLLKGEYKIDNTGKMVKI